MMTGKSLHIFRLRGGSQSGQRPGSSNATLFEDFGKGDIFFTIYAFSILPTLISARILISRDEETDMDRTFEIEDAAGKRTVTIAQFRAEMDARNAEAKKISDAWRAGNIKATEAAQRAFRVKFA